MTETRPSIASRTLRRLRDLGLLSTAAAVLAGCMPVAQFEQVKLAPDEAPVMNGPAVRYNATPLDGAMACFSNRLRQAKRSFAVAVGEIKDYTGKISQLEGTAVTQGGALMMYSALGRLAPSIRLLERFDTRIGESELAYMDRRQLGNGQANALNGGPVLPGQTRGQVPWEPYFGGSILGSEYYIVGGITEVNYNIQSGGAEIAVNSAGPRARTFTLNVAVDLRIVDTKSLVVVRTATFEKQMTGYEVGAGVFRFFGINLFDINVGAKNQEPIQLGVRTTLQYAALDLIGTISQVDYRPCIPSPLSDGIGPLAAMPLIPRPPRIVQAPAPNLAAAQGVGGPQAVAARFPQGGQPVQQAQRAPMQAAPVQAAQPRQAAPVATITQVPAASGSTISVLPSPQAPTAAAPANGGSAQLNGGTPLLASNFRPL